MTQNMKNRPDWRTQTGHSGHSGQAYRDLASACRPYCGIIAPLSGEPNCDCEPGPVRITRAPQPPMGTHGHPRAGETRLDRSNGGER